MTLTLALIVLSLLSATADGGRPASPEAEAHTEPAHLPTGGGGRPANPDTTAARLTFTPVAGTALEADTSSSPSAAWADVDGDGEDDLYVLNGFATLAADPAPQANRLYLNRGGDLVPAPDHPLVRDTAFSGSAVWGDYDNDGDDDLFVANQRGADNFLYRNDGGGAFTRITDDPVARDGGRSFSAAWVDVDGDGWLDLHVLNGRDGDGGEVDFLYRNRGDGSSRRVRDVAPVADALPSGGAAWADHDGDGDPDLFLPVHSGEPNRLYRNDGEWTFTEVAGRAGLVPDPLPFSPPTSVATWADLDDDSDLDLVIAVWGGASEIWLNDGGGALQPADVAGFGERIVFASSVSANDIDGAWLEVEVEGRRSNRSAIGARVTVTAEIGGIVRRQVRHVSSRTSWRSAGGPARHFGLGDADRVERIVVAWPSGRTDTLTGPIEVNRRLRITEE